MKISFAFISKYKVIFQNYWTQQRAESLLEQTLD